MRQGTSAWQRVAGAFSSAAAGGKPARGAGWGASKRGGGWSDWAEEVRLHLNLGTACFCSRRPHCVATVLLCHCIACCAVMCLQLEGMQCHGIDARALCYPTVQVMLPLTTAPVVVV